MPIDDYSGVWWLINTIPLLMICGVLAWSLAVKKRSLFNLFYLLIPILGMIIVWGMSDNSSKQDKNNE